jgi:diketogulonate reductase-like aldo/keto reductase
MKAKPSLSVSKKGSKEEEWKVFYDCSHHHPGVSNFSSPKLKHLLSVCRIRPIVNQVELNPYFPQKGLVKFCQENDIHVTAYGPLGCTPVPYLIGRRGPGPLEDPTVRFYTL